MQKDYSPSIMRAAMATADNITAQAICEGRRPQTMVGAVVLLVLKFAEHYRGRGP